MLHLPFKLLLVSPLRHLVISPVLNDQLSGIANMVVYHLGVFNGHNTVMVSMENQHMMQQGQGIT